MSNFLVTNPKNSTINQAENITVHLNQNSSMGYKDNMGGKASHVGIITILEEEAYAVKKVLALVEEKYKIGERLYYSGAVKGDGCFHQVVMSQTIAQGTTSVISTYKDMMQKYNPKIVILTGIAGGISEKCQYCDVIIANQIICYDLHKETPDRIIRRGNVYHVKSTLIPVVQRLLSRNIESKIPSAEGSISDAIKVYSAPIGSGSAVIANELSETVQWMREFNDKTEAVEMEAAGLSSAFYEDDLNSNGARYGVLCVRGISDLANEEKEYMTNYRKPAAENAAIVVKEIIGLLPGLSD